eukprot:Clim_evm3s81 gene=Clim_evmTU3s81
MPSPLWALYEPRVRHQLLEHWSLRHPTHGRYKNLVCRVCGSKPRLHATVSQLCSQILLCYRFGPDTVAAVKTVVACQDKFKAIDARTDSYELAAELQGALVALGMDPMQAQIRQQDINRHLRGTPQEDLNLAMTTDLNKIECGGREKHTEQQQYDDTNPATQEHLLSSLRVSVTGTLETVSKVSSSVRDSLSSSLSSVFSNSKPTSAPAENPPGSQDDGDVITEMAVAVAPPVRRSIAGDANMREINVA